MLARAAMGIFAVALCLIASPVVADPVTVIVFLGQSNMNALGTQKMTLLPGDPAFNGSCTGYVTSDTPAGASSGAGTLTCVGDAQGVIIPGQNVSYDSADGTLIVSSSNVSATMPSVTGTGGLGSYVVTAGAAVGSASAPVALGFTMPDIGGSGQFNANCMIWKPGTKKSAGTWQINHPFVNTGPIAPAHMFGPETAFCQQWTAANPGQTLYMIKASQGGSFLCHTLHSNDISPESKSTATQVYNDAQQQTALAEAALSSQLGIASYALAGVIYVQGEQDTQSRVCGFPLLPFNAAGVAASVSSPNVYLANLTDLINRMAIEQTISASFNGSIAGTVLMVSSLNSGAIHQYQTLSGLGVAPNSYIDSQIDGLPGDVGHYNVLVNQPTTTKIRIAAASGASTACGYISGSFFLADPLSKSTSSITKSCVTGGQFGIDAVLSGTGVAPNTVITALDSAGHTADGIYTINVLQSVDDEPMTATVNGWGTGASTARFITNRTADQQAVGVGLAQQSINDVSGSTALAAVTVNTNDRWIFAVNPIHYTGAWLSEFGRRLYQAYIGQCDYHRPTC